MEEKGEDLSAELLLNGLESQLEELDEAEYDLPSVSAPTLESILNETADEEDDVVSNSGDSEFGRLLGTFDTESLVSFDDPDRRRKRRVYEGHGSVLKHTVLKGISSQIVSAQTRINAGSPTAMVVDVLIAIGTAHGIVYIFDPSQAMKWSLGSTNTGVQYGSVSCLAFNVDCNRLLAGYAKGQITMWDLDTGKLLRTITDVHPMGQAVLHVKFTDNRKVALCADSGGSVFDMEFNRSVSGRGCVSRCLFSGSRGEVCVAEPLHIPEHARNATNAQTMLVAMITFTKVVVINLRPEVKIVFSFPLPGQADCLPLLSWIYAGIKISGKDALFDPVLAVARESTFHFFQAIIRSAKTVEFQRLQTSEVSYKVGAFCWINSMTLAVMDTSEKIHLVDVRSWEELEVLDMCDMQFVYSTSFFKGLATGGNVSPALSYAGDHACYYSMMTFKSQLFVLGKKSVHVMTTRTWQERLDVLLRENRHQDAIALALTFYEGTAKSVIGLPSRPERRQKIVADKLLDILYTYVDLSMTKLCPVFGRIDELINHYENVVPICVEYCLRLNRIDVLFGRLYERFRQDVIAHGAFLECLEPFILDDQLKAVSPEIIKDLTSHFQGKDMLSRVEACIVHLNIISLDIHETVKVCWENGMYDAIIYISNQGMQDYITPLLDLTQVLRDAINSGKQLSDTHVKLGNKLLVYISNSLAGLAYPIGSLDVETAAEVKKAMFTTLTSLHSNSANPSEKPYPYMRTFLDFDTREFLNVMALAFEEDEFGSSDKKHLRQKVVDILLQIMVDETGYTPKQTGMLYTFLARQLARHNSSIRLNKRLFEQVVEFLCKPGDDSHKEERQEALLELLTVEKELQINVDKILAMAEHANLFRVCEFIFKKYGLHDKILLTYLNDPTRCHQAFSFIELTLTDQLINTIHEKIVDVTLAHLKPLTECDSVRTARLLVDVLRVNLLQVVNSLEGEGRTQYQLLQALVTEREARDTIMFDTELYDIYVELMCKYDSSLVEMYLKTGHGYADETVYQICKKYHQYDSMAFLLEKMGKVQEAFDMMLKTFKEKIDLFMEQITDKRASKHTSNISLLCQQIDGLLLKAIGLCQRNCGRLSEQQREALWFPLLDAVVEPQHKLSSDNSHITVFKDASRQVMNCMMGYIELPAIMAKILKEFTFSEGRFGDVKDLVMGMLGTYNYEKTLMSTVSSMLNGDLMNQLVEKRSLHSKAYVPVKDTCAYCNKHVMSTPSRVQLTVFRCGHMFHEACLDRSGTYTHTLDDEVVYSCYLCSQSEHTRSRPASSSHGLQRGESVSTPSQSTTVQSQQRKISAMNSVPNSTNHNPASQEVAGAFRRQQTERRRNKLLSTADLTLRLIPPSCIDSSLLDDT